MKNNDTYEKWPILQKGSRSLFHHICTSWPRSLSSTHRFQFKGSSCIAQSRVKRKIFLGCSLECSGIGYLCFAFAIFLGHAIFCMPPSPGWNFDGPCGTELEDILILICRCGKTSFVDSSHIWPHNLFFKGIVGLRHWPGLSMHLLMLLTQAAAQTA